MQSKERKFSRMQNDMEVKSNTDKKKTAEWKKVVLALAVFVGIVLAIIYLGIVFLNFLSRGSDINKVRARRGYTMPIVPMECKQVLQDTSLNPGLEYKQSKVEKYQLPEFKEYGNVWLWDGGKTMMYDSNILKHPVCVSFLLEQMTPTYKRLILVIYDKQLKSEVLVIRNYNK